MSTARPAFRPQRPRASLSSLPSTSIPLPHDGENTAPGGAASTSALVAADGSTLVVASTSSTATRRKRAQSLGGAALDDARKKARRSSVAAVPLLPPGELSPGKIARRKLVPRRSILKAVPAVFEDPTATLSLAYDHAAHTTDLSALSTVPFAKKRRQSLAPPTLVDQSQPEDEEEDDSSSDDGEVDMDLTGVTGTMSDDRRKSLARRVSFAPNAHIRTFTPDKPTAQAQLLLQQQQQQLYAAQLDSDEPCSSGSDPADRSNESMEMATDVTHAFAGHFAGTVPLSVYDQPEEDDDASEDSDEDMQVADADVTSAYASQLTVLRNSQLEPVDPVVGVEQAKPKPRFSEVARMEDDEDAELLRQLGLQKGQRPPAASVSFGGVPSSSDDEEEEVEGGEEATMDMTVAMGKVLSQADQEEDDEDDDDADRSVDMSFATVAGGGLDRTLDHSDVDTEPEEAAEEAAAPSIIPQLSIVAPSTPSARLQAQLFQRQSLSLGGPSSPRPNSPRRVVNPGFTFPPPTSTSSAAPSLPRPLPPASPRRVGSPTKSQQQQPPASPMTPRRASRVQSVSPIKKPTTPKPIVTAGPQLSSQLTNSARRTPGGSLSLKGLMEEQRKLQASPPKKSPARPTFVPPPAPQRRWDSPKGSASRVEEMKAAAAATEEDNTGSSYGLYGDEDNLPEIKSLDAFFHATEMHFHKDISGFAGVDLAHKSRKSIVPQQLEGREPSGPPSFADHIVAGACKALFHTLYRSDEGRLSEDINQTMQSLRSCDEALEHDPPTVFKEWLTAPEAHRAIMLNQFRMIKTHYYLSGRIDWMAYRSHNIAQIVEVMIENLEGLRLDNEVVEAAAFDEVIPDLEERHAALKKELEEERARDEELATCDQDDLAALQEAIVEQGEQLKLHEEQTEEAQSQLVDLNARAADLAEQELASASENEQLRQALELGRISTKAEVFRLNAEYLSLQKIAGWKLVEFTKTAVGLSHLDEFDVSLQLDHGVVRIATFALRRKPSATEGLSGEVTRFLFSKVIENVQWILDPANEGQNLRAKSIISRISSLWTCARRLRREILTTHHRFPTSAQLLHSGALRVAVEVHVPKAKATFNVVFEVTGDELFVDDERRPAEVDAVLRQVASDVQVRFGKVDTESLKYIVRERLDVGGRGALLEACNEAEAKYL